MYNLAAHIRNLENTYPASERESSFYKEMVETCKNPRHEHVLATPLFEVLGISIHCANPSLFDNRTAFEIYGVVRVTDEEGTTFDVYNQEQDCPEFISLGGNLSLSGEHCGVVSLSNTFKVELNLRDRARDVVIVKGLFSMNCRTKDDFEQVRVKHVPGEQGCFAVVRCITFQHAVVATLEVLCKTNDGRSDRAANIHGRIVASYGHNYKYSAVEDNVGFDEGKTNGVCFDEKKVNDVPEAAYTSCVLFDKSVNQSVQVKFGSPIPLNRAVVAVPASTTLVLEVDLVVCDSDRQHKFASGLVEFDACGGGGESRAVSEPNGPIKVFVYWHSALKELSAQTNLIQRGDGVSDLSKFAEQQNVLQFLSYLQSPLAVKRNRKSKRLGSPLVEVFSVSVHADKGEVHNLYGTITICDAFGDFCMLNKDESSSEKDLHIVWPPRSFAATEFDMLLNLKDDEEPISYGYLTWDHIGIEVPISWYHRRLCSIIRGRYGYTAVHYIFLKDALQGALKILLCGKSSSDICSNVWGRVSAYYNDYKYSTCYERENYQSLLFSQPKENSLQVTCGSEIQLSRSVIAVPTEAYLIIDAELWVTSSPAEPPEPVLGIVEVKGERRDGTFKGFIPKNHDAQKYHLEVYVECSYVPEF